VAACQKKITDRKVCPVFFLTSLRPLFVLRAILNHPWKLAIDENLIRLNGHPQPGTLQPRRKSKCLSVINSTDRGVLSADFGDLSL